jgi:hypothetical protein
MDEIDQQSMVTVNANNQNEISKRSKRQAATIAKDAIIASHQPNSTSGSSIDINERNVRQHYLNVHIVGSSNADDGNDHDAIPSDIDDDDDMIESKTKRISPSAVRRRGTSAASKKRAVSKKSKGKASATSTDDGDSEDDTVRTPTKKTRTSANKKTPEISEEYARKLRPRK